MFLYSPEAMVALGDITPAQMATFLCESLASSNQALVNSEINAVFTLGHVAQVRKVLGTC